jgi:hypothetical protein
MGGFHHTNKIEGMDNLLQGASPQKSGEDSIINLKIACVP